MSEVAPIGSEFSEGTILDGKYRVEKVVGTGGMGAVLLARHLALDELVAIKVLLPQAQASPEIVERFVREARASIKIKSEHVARVMDVCRLQSGTPYMVMEYLAGEDLARRLARTGAQAVHEAMDIILQVCEALAEAHALGIIHRDIKPANLFLIEGMDGLEIAKVLDFGISKCSILGGTSASMTQTETRMGSPLYMSPEQMKSSKEVDAGTDIWALGVTIHELLTGKVPYSAQSLPELFHVVMTTPAPGIRSLRPDLPVALEKVVLKCLSKDRAHRYRSILELADALYPFGTQRARESRDHVARVVARSKWGHRPEVTPHPPEPNETVVSGQTTVGPPRRPLEARDRVSLSSLAPWGQSHISKPRLITRASAFTFVALGLVGASVLVYAWIRERSSDDEPPAPTSRAQAAEANPVPANSYAASTRATASASSASVVARIGDATASASAEVSEAQPRPAPMHPTTKRRSQLPKEPNPSSYVPTDFGSRR